MSSKRTGKGIQLGRERDTRDEVGLSTSFSSTRRSAVEIGSSSELFLIDGFGI